MKHSKRFWSDLFYVPKYEKVSDKAFLRIMLSSVFGILICGICLAGLTWAWFSSSITSAANTITAAKFMVNISVIEKVTNTPLTPTEENGRYTYALTSSTEYTVIITANGDAEKYGGYCSVSYLRPNPYHTIQLYPGTGDGKIHSVTFTVNASEGSTLTITPQWGTCAVEVTAENPRIGSQKDTEKHIVNSIGTPPEHMTTAEASEQSEERETANALTDTEQSYTVQQGDTLSKIANRYGTTAEVLSAYNIIESTAIIQVGDALKIPPASYTIPDTSEAATD